MKKMMAAFLAALLLLQLSGCTSGGKGSSDPALTSSQMEDATQEESGTVKITLPIGLIAPEGGMTEALTQEEKDNGFLEKSVAEETVTYTMTKKAYKAFLQESRSSTAKMLEDIPKQEGTTIEKVEYTENFREITFSADKEAAESNLADAIAVMSAGITVCVFQAYLAEEEIKTTIYMKDKTTGEVYDTTIYPDVFESSKGES